MKNNKEAYERIKGWCDIQDRFIRDKGLFNEFEEYRKQGQAIPSEQVDVKVLKREINFMCDEPDADLGWIIDHLHSQNLLATKDMVMIKRGDIPEWFEEAFNTLEKECKEVGIREDSYLWAIHKTAALVAKAMEGDDAR